MKVRLERKPAKAEKKSYLHQKSSSLALSCENLAELFSCDATLGMSVVQSNRAFQYINPAFTKMFGYTMNDVHKKRIWLPSGCAIRDSGNKRLKTPGKRAAPGDVIESKIKLRCKNGKEKTVLMCSLRLENRSSLNTYREIGDQIKRSDIGRQSDLHFFDVFRKSPLLMAITKLQDRHFVDVNDIFLKTLGYKRNEVIGKTSAELGIFRDIAQRDAVIEILRKKGFAQHVEVDILTRDRELRYGLFSAQIILINGREYLLTSMIDITEQKQFLNELKDSEERLRGSREKYRELVDSINTAVVIYEAVEEGKDFVIKGCNRAGCRIEQVQVQDIVGRRLTDVFPGVKDFGLLEVFSRVWKTGNPEYYPVSFYKDNRISGWRENFIYKLHSGEIVAVYEDVTERKQAEEKLLEEKHLQEVLLREVNHRVKNNLQIISSLTNLQSSLIKDPKVKEIFKENQSRIMSIALVHEKLYQSKDLSRVNIEEYFSALLKSIIHSFHLDLNKVRVSLNIEKEVDFSIDKIVNCGLIVNELLVNAIKYAFPGESRGEIRLELKLSEKGVVLLTVADDGVGLPAGFDIGKTHTLGLVLVQSLAKQLGSLKIRSGPGTSFTVSILDH